MLVGAARLTGEDEEEKRQQDMKNNNAFQAIAAALLEHLALRTVFRQGCKIVTVPPICFMTLHFAFGIADMMQLFAPNFVVKIIIESSSTWTDKK